MYKIIWKQGWLSSQKTEPARTDMAGLMSSKIFIRLSLLKILLYFISKRLLSGKDYKVDRVAPILAKILKLLNTDK